MKKLLAALAFATAGTALPALAQTDVLPPEVSFDASVLATTDFLAIDADASGGVSYDELLAIVPDLTAEDFTAIDVDLSGDISEDELKAVTPATM
ncbi:MAG: hypothetical protein KKH72_06385 [Alphaproteobacteria bacterium]|nr:hypothetical protein [Alphaproteobacteria bacterium]